jgi:hypothetical protein
MCIVGGCRWIEREDFLEQLREGREIFCGAPVERQGEAWCSVHRARVYVDPAAPVARVGDLRQPQQSRYLALRRSGVSHERALEATLVRAEPIAA